jgi:hypothetical protein
LSRTLVGWNAEVVYLTRDRFLLLVRERLGYAAAVGAYSI